MTTKHGATWLASDQFLARSVGRPLQRFLHIEASGGLLLVLAVVVALVWANSPWDAAYHSLWSSELTIELAGHTISEDLRHWINDGLMTLFFFVIGMEIKAELTSGQLARPADAAVPIAGALGGMLVPAAIYAAFTAGGTGAAGWGVPMATDIAFALGVLALLGDRVPSNLKVVLLGLAIVDDVGAIVVIALFYTGDLQPQWLAAAAVGLALIALLRQIGVRYLPVYVVIGVAVWLATFESGVHATLAGVALGLLTPARPLLPEVDADRIASELSEDRSVTAAEVRDISFRIRESIPTTERLQDLLHPWTSYLIVPLFALANAGIPLTPDAIAESASSAVTVGVAAGLVVGKLAGITGAIALVLRLRLGRLPAGIAMRDIVGMSAIAGIGFTVSIFIAGLAFDDPALTDQATIGVLVATVLAAAGGAAIFATGHSRRSDPDNTVTVSPDPQSVPARDRPDRRVPDA